MSDCVNNRTCQSLTMHKKDHKRSELKITTSGNEIKTTLPLTSD